MTAKTNTTGQIVFTGTSDWFRIVSDRGEIVLAEVDWSDGTAEAASIAEINADDPESWVACVAEVDAEHGVIRVGDYACCNGVGSDVVFVRLEA